MQLHHLSPGNYFYHVLLDFQGLEHMDGVDLAS